MNTRLVVHLIVMIGWGVWMLTGCSKPVQTGQGPDQTTPDVNANATPPQPTLPPQQRNITSADPREWADGATDVATVEQRYTTATTMRGKIGALRSLAALGTADAVVGMGRMFHLEKDTELREEILEMLLSVKGHDVEKLTVLSAAVAANQPVTVREAAIDVMIELGSQDALTVLQNLVKDKDPVIREAAEDAIAELSAPPNTKKMSSVEIDVDED